MLVSALVPMLGVATVRAQSSLPAKPICGFELVWKNLEQQVPGFRQQYDAFMQEQMAAADAQARPTGTVYDIPVVFHVVYYQNGNTIKGNIPDSVILNQLAVLNRAYRKTHADTGNLRAIFKPLSADAEIRFHLATKDPNGNTTTGITRTATNIEYFGDIGFLQGDMTSIERIKKTAQGGKDAWDTKRYLNIWIADMSISFGGQATPALMGIATPPLNPVPSNWPAGTAQMLHQMIDGVIIQFQVVGNNNPYIAQLAAAGVGTQGRTAVHEVGHYLGLRHIWGDPEAGQACTAQGDDGIGDTPAQADKTDMALNPPSATQNTCGAGTTGDLPDLWENYMDYSKDNFQSMFTQGQVTWMRSICANQRDSLFLNPPPTGIASVNGKEKPLLVYPQPAAQYLNIDFDGKIDQVRIVDMLGKTVVNIAGAKAVARKVDVSNLSAGNYFLQLVSEGHAYNRQVSVLRQ